MALRESFHREIRRSISRDQGASSSSSPSKCVSREGVMQNNKQPKKKKKKRVPEEWVLFLIDALYKVGATLNRARSALGLSFCLEIDRRRGYSEDVHGLQGVDHLLEPCKNPRLQYHVQPCRVMVLRSCNRSVRRKNGRVALLPREGSSSPMETRCGQREARAGERCMGSGHISC